MATEKADYKELRRTFYECRNFEINNLWQKSVLLTAFIVITFTLYGSILSKLFENSQNLNIIILHEICSGISLVGFIFSIIWIMMGKGSKAWYELYENAIWNVEREELIDIPEKYAMGRNEIFSYPDSNIFTSKGGKYSPSKLNIIIGRFLMIIWFIVFVIHSTSVILLIKKKIEKGACPCLYCIIECLLIVSFLIILISAILNLWAKSSFFE